MRISKRAWISLIKNYKGTILLGLVFFALGVLLAGALVIRQGALAAETSFRSRIPPFIMISLDPIWEASLFERETGRPAREAHQHFQETALPPIMELPFAKTIHEVDDQVFSFFDIQTFLPVEDPQSIPEGNAQWLRTIGTSSSLPPLIQAGSAELTAGRSFSDAELAAGALSQPVPVLISRMVSENNALEVGSSFKMYHMLSHPQIDPALQGLEWTIRQQELLAQLIIELEVIGIYDLPFHLQLSEWDEGFIPTSRALNAIFVPLWFNGAFDQLAHQIFTDAWGEDGGWTIFSSNPPSILLALENPLELQDFLEALAPLVPPGFRIQNLSAFYDVPLNSLQVLTDFAEQAFLAALFATLVMISLVLTFHLKERRVELGIYLSLGAGKLNVMKQIWQEIAIILLCALPFSVGMGYGLSRWLSRRMLYLELTSMTAQTAQSAALREVSSLASDIALPLSLDSARDLLNIYPISPSWPMLLLLTLTSAAIIFLATAIPMLYLLKLNPKRLLL